MPNLLILKKLIARRMELYCTNVTQDLTGFQRVCPTRILVQMENYSGPRMISETCQVWLEWVLTKKGSQYPVALVTALIFSHISRTSKGVSRISRISRISVTT